MLHLFDSLLKKKPLGAATSEQLMGEIIQGQIKVEQISAILMGLEFQAPHAQTIVGFVKAFRKANKQETSYAAGDDSLIDVCGTGGDGKNSFNVSTAAALVLSAAGQKVAKHGNRAISSRCGSFDVLEALNIPFSENISQAKCSLEKNRIAFMFGPSFHPAYKNLAPLRKALGFRTLLNVLGPLLNPLEVRRQLVGVYSADLVLPVAKALAELGAKHIMVVNGNDGMDEISIRSPSLIAEYNEGQIKTFSIYPEDFGIYGGDINDIAGGSAVENATLIRQVFRGKKGGARNILSLNAAAGLVVADKVGSIREGLEVIYQTIDSGKATTHLEKISEVVSC